MLKLCGIAGRSYYQLTSHSFSAKIAEFFTNCGWGWRCKRCKWQHLSLGSHYWPTMIHMWDPVQSSVVQLHTHVVFEIINIILYILCCRVVECISYIRSIRQVHPGDLFGVSSHDDVAACMSIYCKNKASHVKNGECRANDNKNHSIWKSPNHIVIDPCCETFSALGFVTERVTTWYVFWAKELEANHPVGG